MNSKIKSLGLVSSILLFVGFVVFLVYAICLGIRNENDYEIWGWVVIDVILIGSAIIGLLLPQKFEKLGGFSIVGLTFANLVRIVVSGFGYYTSLKTATGNGFIICLGCGLAGSLGAIAILFIMLSIAFNKCAKKFVFVVFASYALIVIGQLALTVVNFIGFPASVAGIDSLAILLIWAGLGVGLLSYSWLFKNNLESKDDVLKKNSETVK